MCLFHFLSFQIVSSNKHTNFDTVLGFLWIFPTYLLCTRKQNAHKHICSHGTFDLLLQLKFCYVIDVDMTISEKGFVKQNQLPHKWNLNSIFFLILLNKFNFVKDSLKMLCIMFTPVIQKMGFVWSLVAEQLVRFSVCIWMAFSDITMIFSPSWHNSWWIFVDNLTKHTNNNLTFRSKPWCEIHKNSRIYVLYR